MAPLGYGFFLDFEKHQIYHKYMKKSEELLNQMIEIAKAEDLKLKEKETKGNGSRTVGESWMTFHLRLLKELLEREK